MGSFEEEDYPESLLRMLTEEERARLQALHQQLDAKFDENSFLSGGERSPLFGPQGGQTHAQAVEKRVDVGEYPSHHSASRSSFSRHCLLLTRHFQREDVHFTNHNAAALEALLVRK
jgi:hypothetical protein